MHPVEIVILRIIEVLLILGLVVAIAIIAAVITKVVKDEHNSRKRGRR